jgi:cytochrome c553
VRLNRCVTRLLANCRAPACLLLLLAVAFALWAGASAQSASGAPAVRVPSDVTWTDETIALISDGKPFRGLLIARRCNHCHGQEGFSAVSETPNLAGIDRFSLWKQLQDFRSGKRGSVVMEPIAALLSARAGADVAAYYSMLPTLPDPQDQRAFPGNRPEPSEASLAVPLIILGNAQRGIPPCQACHGPVGYVTGAPLLAAQNAGYLLGQLESFADGSRANDINMRMRSIARQLTPEERKAIADYYGAGLGPGASSQY